MERNAAPPSPLSSREWWWVLDPRLSLRALAALTVGGGAALFVGLMVWFTGKIFERSLETQIGPSLELIAQQVSDKVDRGIYERRRALEFATGLPLMRALPADATGAGQHRQLLNQLKQTSPDFVWLGVANVDGTIVFATDRVLEGSSVAMRQWFRAGQEGLFAGRVQEFPELARRLNTSEDELAARFFDLSAPILDENGRVMGVLGAYLKWSGVRDVASSVIAEAAHQNRIGVTIYAAPNDAIFDSGASGWTLPPNAPGLPNARRFRGSMLEHSSAGTEYLTGYVRSRGYRDFRGAGWLITARQPLARAFAPASELRSLMLRWGACFVVAAAVASWILAGRLARRLWLVGAAANRIREGDILTVLPRPPGDGELARMCGALADMVDDFRAKQDAHAAEKARLTAEAPEREGAKQ